MKLCGLLDRLGCSCGEAQAAAATRRRARAMISLVIPVIRGPSRSAAFPATARVRSNRPTIRNFYGA